MQRRSFVKGTSAAGLLTTGGLITTIMGHTKAHMAKNPGTAVHYKRSLESARYIPGGIMHFLITKEQTNGEYALLEGIGRRGFEPPMHVHKYEDEGVLLLGGEVIFTVGDEKYHGHEGDYIFMPKGIPHTFQVVSEKIHALLILTPGGLEQYFWELGMPATDFEPAPLPTAPPSAEVMKMVGEINAKYGISHP